MTVQTQQVLKKAIHLPPVERAELVEQILSSFDHPSREQNRRALGQKKRKIGLMHTTKAKSRQSLQSQSV